MPLDMHSNVTSYHKMGLIIMNNYLAQNQVLFFYKAKYENISLLIEDKPKGCMRKRCAGKAKLWDIKVCSRILPKLPSLELELRSRVMLYETQVQICP